MSLFQWSLSCKILFTGYYTFRVFSQTFTIGLVVSCCKGRRSYIGDTDSSDEESEDEYYRSIGT